MRGTVELVGNAVCLVRRERWSGSGGIPAPPSLPGIVAGRCSREAVRPECGAVFR